MNIDEVNRIVIRWEERRFLNAWRRERGFEPLCDRRSDAQRQEEAEAFGILHRIKVRGIINSRKAAGTW